MSQNSSSRNRAVIGSALVWLGRRGPVASGVGGVEAWPLKVLEVG